MQRFKNILVLYNQKIGDEAALERATTLAKENGARLTVAEALERLPSDTLALLGPPSGDALNQERRFVEERRAHLDRLVTSIRQDVGTVDALVLLGKPFLEVIRAVLRERFDLVIMTADVVRGLREIAFGSTSMHLMRKCPCPVWVMQPNAGRRFKRIMAAVNPPVGEQSPNGLNAKILQLASSLARDEQCDLEILHAWDFRGADLDTSRSEISEDMKAQLIERNEAAHQAAMNLLLGAVDLGGVKFDLLLPKGDPATVIPQAARDHEVDLIIMGTVARTGISGFFISDTAEMVLQQVNCSVLAVKPDGFVTPVTLDG